MNSDGRKPLKCLKRPGNGPTGLNRPSDLDDPDRKAAADLQATTLRMRREKEGKFEQHFSFR